MLVALSRAGDWDALAGLLQSLGETLALPMPAVSVSAAGFQVWFSLAEAQPRADATAFVQGLRARFLADVPDAFVRIYPGDADLFCRVPAFDEASGRWSAFIDPGMGSMFASEPGLDIPPGTERQAEMLAGLKSISSADFARILGSLVEPSGAVEPPGTPESRLPACPAGLRGRRFADPAEFLLAAMNDESVSVADRIRAAAALLRLPSS